MGERHGEGVIAAVVDDHVALRGAVQVRAGRQPLVLVPEQVEVDGDAVAEPVEDADHALRIVRPVRDAIALVREFPRQGDLGSVHGQDPASLPGRGLGGAGEDPGVQPPERAPGRLPARPRAVDAAGGSACGSPTPAAAHRSQSSHRVVRYPCPRGAATRRMTTGMISRLSNTRLRFRQRASSRAATAVAAATGVSKRRPNRRSEAAERPRPARVGGFGLPASRSPRRISRAPSRSGIT